MISQKIISFLDKLKSNNNKPWFDENRIEYDIARELFIQSVQHMIGEMSKVEVDMINLQPKDCIFRINRDVRFSKDKRPYKHNMSAYFNRAGKKGHGPGYYIHIEPGKSFFAAGIWMPEAEELKKIRQEIDYNFREWKSIIGNSEFKNKFGGSLEQSSRLVRPPKGYNEKNPAIEFLKLKSFVISHSFHDKDIYENKFLNNFQKLIKAAIPFTHFLKTAVE